MDFMAFHLGSYATLRLDSNLHSCGGAPCDALPCDGDARTWGRPCHIGQIGRTSIAPAAAPGQRAAQAIAPSRSGASIK